MNTNPKMKCVCAFTSLLFLLTLTSCKKDENQKIKFRWAKNGTVLFYDLYKGTDITRDHLKLEVSENQFFQNGVASNSPLDILPLKFEVKRGGLYGLACESCGMGIVSCLTKFQFLYAPNSPSLNQELPQYSCGRDVDYNIRIIETNNTVTVPLGTFKSYIMLHKGGDKSYWSADDGLIMYEKIDSQSKAIIETYKLNRIID